MNKASIGGLLLVAITTIFGITFVMATGSFDFSLLRNFWDIPSILIVFGGSLATMLITEKDVISFFSKLGNIRIIFRKAINNELETIRTIIALSNVARKEGLLALEEATFEIEDEFLRKSILLIVDGTDPELVRSILENELNCIEDRHFSVVGFWDSLASMGPAWGMIGTLIGLINMLGDLNELETIGANMAVALVTTFYGSLIANAICVPVVAKLKALHNLEMRNKEIIIEGALSIQAGENPRVIEEKLKAFVKPSDRNSLNQQEDLREEANV
ncbi:MAG: motility protein A [Clostridiales bacterium]|nr:motility protein A [Clostridiales bacterium]